MKPMGLTSRPIWLHQIGVFTQEKALKETYYPLKVTLETVESVEIKIAISSKLIKVKGKFIKITKDFTKQERILIKAKILWDFSIQTDREVRNKKTRHCHGWENNHKKFLWLTSSCQTTLLKSELKNFKNTQACQWNKNSLAGSKSGDSTYCDWVHWNFLKRLQKDMKKIDIVDESKTCMAQKIVLLGTAYLVCAFMNIILVFSIWKVLRETRQRIYFFGNSSNFKFWILNTWIKILLSRKCAEL